MPHLILIAAVGRNRAIGLDNQLLWHLPEDLAHFKETTAGHAVLMGRRTWESLPPRFRPLPGRRNLILSRQADFRPEGAEVSASLDQALSLLAADERLFIIGGADLYAQTLPLANTLILTEVDDAPVADAFFPEVSPQNWQESARESHRSASGLNYAFVRYQRVTR